MSPTGALVLSLSALVALGALAAWLLNAPPWAVALLVVVGALAIRLLVRRIGRRAPRQNTEA